MSIHARLLSTLLIVAAATGCDDPQENPDEVAACTSKLPSAGDRLGEGGTAFRGLQHVVGVGSFGQGADLHVDVAVEEDLVVVGIALVARAG